MIDDHVHALRRPEHRLLQRHVERRQQRVRPRARRNHHRVRADLEYLSNWSLALDLLILLRTLNVVAHKNAF